MAKPLLTDELWEHIKQQIPPEPPKPKGGRPRISNRACLTGILFILKTGAPWEYLPLEMRCGSGISLLALILQLLPDIHNLCPIHKDCATVKKYDVVIA
jgi:hypothetical protein